MAPSRRPKQKVDNCSYVRQLFKNFLDNNRSKKVTEVFPQVVSRPVQRFPIESGIGDNVFRQGVKRNLLKAQVLPDQANPVKEFFANPEDGFKPVINPSLANQPVHARFKRQEGSDQFVKSTLSPNAPTRGLAQWLNMRKKTSNEQRLSNQQSENKKKVGEYLELPKNFFSGREAMKLPFEAPKTADRTVMSVASTFIPPATSTPFDGKPVVGSPILSDPLVELTRREAETEPAEDYEQTLRTIETMFDQLCTSFCPIESTPLERNYRSLRELWKEHCFKEPSVSAAPMEESRLSGLIDRSSWKDHSLISNQIHHQYRQQAPLALVSAEPSLFGATDFAGPSDVLSTMIDDHLDCDRDTKFTLPELDTTSSSFLRVCVSHSRKRKIIDSLLTESPPSPPSILSQAFNDNFSLENDLPPTRHDTLQFDLDFTQPLNRTFEFDETRKDDSFCFFPPTPAATDDSSTDETLFFAQKPLEFTRSTKTNETNFFDLFP